MSVSNEDIYDALATIKQACNENYCDDCPMRVKKQNGSVCGVMGKDPTRWEFGNPPGNWKAFKEED